MGRIVSIHHLTAAEKGESSRDAERSEQIAQAPTDEAADAGALVLVSQPPGSERRQHDISDDEAGGGFHEEGSREGAEADEELALLEAAFEADEVGELLSLVIAMPCPNARPFLHLIFLANHLCDARGRVMCSCPTGGLKCS